MLSFWTTLSFLTGLSTAAYTLQDDYLAGGDFFSKFNFFTGGDPTHGFVKYLSQSDAQKAGLISQSSSNVFVGTDHTNVQPNGRPSVRLESKKTYNSGLFILDLAHMPGGICGTWPAFWTVGPNWPNNGEIDIIEGVHTGTTNAMTLHTAQGCQITNNGAFTGTINTYDCWVNSPNQSGNAGCSIDTSNTQTYGSGFNNNKGGVYATNFNAASISVWFFPRGSIPSDITNGKPNPDSWGRPLAQFQGNCDIQQFIKNQAIVFDLTFCGDWAGNVWGSSSCSSLASSCNTYVANNPSAFANAYWSINSLKVYQLTSGVNAVAKIAAQSSFQTSYTDIWATKAKDVYTMTMA